MPTRRHVLDISLSILGILLVAINLRPVITAVGPIITVIGDDLSLSASELGVLGALPIAVFGVASIVVQKIVGRFGVEQTTAGALFLLTLATLLRSWPGPLANFWVGTALIGVAIAIGNVAVPIIVKQYFPKATALITSIYVAVLGVFAGLAAALAVPLAEYSAFSWRFSLAVWGILTLIGAVFWQMDAIRKKRASNNLAGVNQTKPKPIKINLWRNPMAWYISFYMGVQSGVFYTALTWLPTVEHAIGISAKAAGWHMFVLQIGGVAGNLLAPMLMRWGRNQCFAAMLPAVLFFITSVGIYFMPNLMSMWVAIMGFGTGTAFVVALSLIAIRASDVTVAGHLSSMGQAVGYIVAAIVLYTTGIAQAIDPVGVLVVIFVVAVLILISGFFAGREKIIAPENMALKTE